MKLGFAKEAPSQSDRPDYRDDPAESFSSVAATIGARNLLVIIVTMPFVFIAVVLGAIAIFGPPDEESAQASATSVRSTAVAAAPVVSSVEIAESDEAATTSDALVLPIPAAVDSYSSAIVLPEGAATGAISLDGDRLALRVDSEEGSMIIIYDLANKSIIQTVPLGVAAQSDQ
ncbi:MAG: hypothetical protein AAGC77_06935 [Pseudomonadota bacterium]